MLLEYALALAADEIVPENWPAMRLREVRNCLFETAGLALASSDAPFVFEREVTGFHARVVQHECDHLDGILYPRRIRDLTQFGFTDVLFPGQLPTED